MLEEPRDYMLEHIKKCVPDTKLSIKLLAVHTSVDLVTSARQADVMPFHQRTLKDVRAFV